MDEISQIEEEIIDNECHITLLANKSIEMSISLSEHCTRLNGLNINSNTSQNNIDSSINILTKRLSSKEHQNLILNEIVLTENKFCDCLTTIIDHYASNIQVSQIIEKEKYDIIFPPSLLNLQIVHNIFCDKLNTAYLENCIADIFLEFITSDNVGLFNIYKDYVNNFSKSLLTIRDLSRDDFAFNQLLKRLQLDERSNRLDLPSLLLNPVQRIPRYVLLLKQLSKHTIENEDLNFLLNKLSIFLEELNSSMRSSLDTFSLVSIHNRPKKNLCSMSLREKMRPFFVGEKNKFVNNWNFKTSTPILRNRKSFCVDDVNPQPIFACEFPQSKKSFLSDSKNIHPSSRTENALDEELQPKLLDLKNPLKFDKDFEVNSLNEISGTNNQFKMPTPLKKAGLKLLPDFKNKIRQKVKRIGSLSIKVNPIKSKKSPIKATISHSFGIKFFH